MGITAAGSAADAEMHKKILGSGNLLTLIISKDEINYIIKIVKSHEDSGLLLKEVTETVQNEVKQPKGGFLSMLLGTLGARLLGSFLTGRGINRAGKGRGIEIAGERIVRAGYVSHSSKMDF